MSKKYILEQVDIFQDLDSNQLAAIEAVCHEKSYSLGEVIFKENLASNEFYIIAEGEVEIQVDPDTIGDGSNIHEPTTIAVLRRGQSFGEVALVDPGVRSASARCRSETSKLLVIERKDFMKLLESNYEMGYVIMRNLAADLALKIRQTNLMVRESLMYAKK
ncbi:MAG: cyclic nucleotide-binding domain-containing protein [Anaerolineales bacterium]|nr:cyclic nucleotide-binding domain-containing protein [Anaerolineales bacterium]